MCPCNERDSMNKDILLLPFVALFFFGCPPRFRGVVHNIFTPAVVLRAGGHVRLLCTVNVQHDVVAEKSTIRANVKCPP